MRWVAAFLIGVAVFRFPFVAFANHFPAPFEYLNGTEPSARIPCSVDAEITCEYPYDHGAGIQYIVVRRGEEIVYVLRRAWGAKAEELYNVRGPRAGSRE